MECIQIEAKFNLNTSPNDDIEEKIVNQILPLISTIKDDEFTLEVE